MEVDRVAEALTITEEGDAPQNMALFRRFAFNLATLSPLKDSMKGKLKRAAWDDAYRTTLIFG